MKITKKFDRAFQWAGEKMGSEAKTSHSEEFRMMETEMALRLDGMEKLQKAMNGYVKWASRRGDMFEDKDKGLPTSHLGRTMVSHGEDFEPDSEFGNCLIAMGRANENVSRLQEQYVAEVTSTWLESLNRSMVMMKEYQASRKKLENRRLAYDASVGKSQKARRDDYRIDEELRTSRAKFEESNEDVLRRMQDIKENEADSVRSLTNFLDAELDFHERCAEELRRARDSWAAGTGPSAPPSRSSPGRYNSAASAPVLPSRARSNTSYSYSERGSRNGFFDEEQEPEPEPVRMPMRSSRMAPPPPSPPSRPAIGARSATTPLSSAYSDRRASSQPLGNMLRQNQNQNQNLRSVNRIDTYNTSPPHRDDVFADRDDDYTTPQSQSGSGSPDWGAADRCASPATSLGSWSRSTTGSTSMQRKGPPPPPPCRSKKPPPPIPPKREMLY